MHQREAGICCFVEKRNRKRSYSWQRISPELFLQIWRNKNQTISLYNNLNGVLYLNYNLDHVDAGNHLLNHLVVSEFMCDGLSTLHWITSVALLRGPTHLSHPHFGSPDPNIVHLLSYIQPWASQAGRPGAADPDVEWGRCFLPQRDTLADSSYSIDALTDAMHSYTYIVVDGSTIPAKVVSLYQISSTGSSINCKLKYSLLFGEGTQRNHITQTKMFILDDSGKPCIISNFNVCKILAF